MSYNYRCSRKACRARITFKRPIEDYARSKKCPACGGETLKKTNDKQRNKRNKCTCDGWLFPHHKGTSVWCVHHPVGPTEEDFVDRYR